VGKDAGGNGKSERGEVREGTGKGEDGEWRKKGMEKAGEVDRWVVGTKDGGAG
jgi:hypothetical protein